MSASMSGVTIVITTFNHAHFLDEALRSALAQTVPAEAVIVVDDGSTDDPAAVVARHPGVRLIRQANQGLSAARNAGLEAATTPYVAFLDADDRLTPVMVATTLECLRRRPDAAFAYGAYINMNEAGRPIGDGPYVAAGPDFYGQLLAGNVIGMHGTVLYRRDLLLAAGGFDPAMRSCEDYDVYLKLATAHPVVSADVVLAEYRRHAAGMSNAIPRMIETALAALGRHRAAADGRPEWRQAYASGVSAFRRFYAERQARQLREAAQARRGVVAQLRNTLGVGRLAPAAMARAMVREARAWHRVRRINRMRRYTTLTGTSPVSTAFGFDRGQPVDRHYIEGFLADRASDIRGRVLEIGDNSYTLRFGGAAVVESDVFNRYPGPGTRYSGDIAGEHDLPQGVYDCIVFTQTLHLIFDMQTAVRTLHDALKPGGVLLITVPWVSPIDEDDWGATWYWSISPSALRRLLSGPFTPAGTTVTPVGNVLTGTAFLYGLAAHEIGAEDMRSTDAKRPLLVLGRAVK